jgi:gamma-glutamyltranspeptidase/glutathione hydrolase
MTHGMVVAPQPEAVEAGALVLRDGGNAVDAGIACALVQGVVDPQMCGIAGFGSLQAYLPGDNVHACIDFHGKSPSAVRPDMWQDRIEGETRDGFGFILRGRVNDVGYQSITVPGSLKAYAEAHAKWGRMSWADVLAPAIAQAEAGVTIRPHMYSWWTTNDGSGRVLPAERLAHTPSGKRIYFHADGSLKRIGERLENPDMAATLRRLAEAGAEDFYTGDIAAQIAADMKANGGLLSADDLASYRTTPNAPMWGDYRGFRLATNQPPGGGIMLIEMLNVLENFDLAGLGHNSLEYIRVVSEAMKRATIDKDTHVGDPAFVDIPVDRLTSKDYARELAELIRRGDKAVVERIERTPESKDTTHVSVVDEHGNAFAMTHSLGMPSGVITEGLGFMYNGCMGVFDPRPGRAGSLAPGKSRFSSMCPTLVFRDGKLHVVIGAPGGTHIVMGVMQALLNVMDFDMSMSDAVAAPRFSGASPLIDVCNRIPRYITDELEDMGYPVTRWPVSYAFAWVHGIRIDDGKWSGGADPATDGMALAV